MKNTNKTNKNMATPGTTTNLPKTGASQTGNWNSPIATNKPGQATTATTQGKNREQLIRDKNKTGNH